MPSADDQELSGILDAALEASKVQAASRKTKRPEAVRAAADPAARDEVADGLPTQWSRNGAIYVPVSKCVNTLEPGMYEIAVNNSVGLYFEKIEIDVEGILRFPDTNSDEVLSSITTFWEREDIFKKYELAFKRGVLLWGPPGSGKTCTVRLLIRDVIERKGVVVKFTNPDLFMTGMRVLRSIQPDTPVVVLMEDIDAILDEYNESAVINILDGVDIVNKIVFLATTNYPEKLGARIVNRPSRFDRRYKIGEPNAASRKLYFEHLIKKEEVQDIDIERWVKDTRGMSISHLKELFVGVCVLGDKYADVLDKLKSMMTKQLSSAEDETTSSGMGFVAKADEDSE